jgi:hypothetical protein
MRLKTHCDNVKGTLSRAQIFTSMPPDPGKGWHDCAGFWLDGAGSAPPAVF